MALHHSASLLKFTTIKTVEGEFKGVSTKQTTSPLELECLGLESNFYQVGDWLKKLLLSPFPHSAVGEGEGALNQTSSV